MTATYVCIDPEALSETASDPSVETAVAHLRTATVSAWLQRANKFELMGECATDSIRKGQRVHLMSLRPLADPRERPHLPIAPLIDAPDYAVLPWKCANSESHLIYYAKGWYAKGDVMNDLRQLVKERTWDPDPSDSDVLLNLFIALERVCPESKLDYRRLVTMINNLNPSQSIYLGCRADTPYLERACRVVLDQIALNPYSVMQLDPIDTTLLPLSEAAIAH